MEEVLDFLTDIHKFTSNKEEANQLPTSAGDIDKIIQFIQAVVRWADRKTALHEVNHSIVDEGEAP